MRTLMIGVFLCLAAAAGATDGSELPAVADVLAAYNAGIDLTASEVESLTVRQVVIEPCDDGEDRTATAVLSYVRGSELERTVLASDLRYPAGEYRLKSLVGPFISEDDYRVTVAGRERMEGEECIRLDVEALERDVDHFDGTVWVSAIDGGPVRIQGGVADPPFPAREILLDKTFALVNGRYRLVRRHTGEVEVGLLLGSRRGVRHIFYEEYAVSAVKRD
ncbi:MAG: hypothetical protein GF405_00265 [Candidatus Eisenbacteria bacterium]|nr:hypothetical protein [Candidatus Eisenbacteria bacterium]